MYGWSEYEEDFDMYDFIEPQALCHGKYEQVSRANHNGECVSDQWWQYLSHKDIRGAKDIAYAIGMAKRYRDPSLEVSEIELGPEQIPEGHIIGSGGKAIRDEEYRGQHKAYRYGKTILDYLSDTNEVDIRTMIQHGIKEGYLSLPEITVDEVWADNGACTDCEIEAVKPYMNRYLEVILEVKVAAEVWLVFCVEMDEILKNCKQEYIVRLKFARPSGQLELLDILDEEELEEESQIWPLDQMLMPVVPYEKTEEFAEFISQGVRLLQSARSHEIFDLKDRGQNQPQYHRITRDNSKGAKIFYREEKAVCYDHGEPEEITVKPGDVWIDMEALGHYISRWNRPDIRVMKWKSYAHEQFHWYSCWAYFRLMELLSKKYKMEIPEGELHFSLSFEFGRQPQKDGSCVPISYMERLAERCVPRLQMPAEVFISSAEKLIKEQKGSGTARIRWGEIIDNLSARFYTTKDSTKLRLVELGYRDAMGAKNWVNNGKGYYCQEYLATPRMDATHTYVISRAEAFQEYRRNPRFKELLRACPFAYVDGHYIVDNAKYIRRDRNGHARLTEYALTHMDECCILFTIRNLRTEYGQRFGVLNETIKSGNKQVELTEDERDQLERLRREGVREHQEFARFKRECADKRLCEVLEIHMRNSALSEFQIANRMGTTNHTISSYRRGESRPDGFMMLKLIIALELRSPYRRHLFSFTGIDLERWYYQRPELEVVDFLLDTNDCRSTEMEWDCTIEEVYKEYYENGFILDTPKRKGVIAALRKAGKLRPGIEMLVN